jgi:hypothetical protein
MSALRVKPDDVQELLGNNYDGEADLKPFVKAANSLVNWIDDTCDTDNLLSTAQLRELELWLACHFYHSQDHMYSSKSTGGASGSFQGQTGMYFDSNFYGQQALLLDVSGCLAKRQLEVKQGGRARVGMTWIGTKASEQADRNDP